MACAEVKVLRSFAAPWRRHKAITSLLRRYGTGRRTAGDVRDGAAALLAQNHVDECIWLFGGAMDEVRPVPTLLWRWGCEHVAALGFGVARRMLRMASELPRLERHLAQCSDELVASVDGVIALIHEGYRFPDWAPAVLRPAIRRYLYESGSREWVPLPATVA